MLCTALPTETEMYRALVARDPGFEGVFFAAVKTTRIFCRPTCPARKPLAENVEYHPTARDALAAGFRPCRRCRPLEPPADTPAWLRGLVEEVERDPARRWRDADLRARKLEPGRVRRWFQTAHGMSFHAYSRTRRLGIALGELDRGMAATAAGGEHGFESESGFREAFEKAFGTAPSRARGVERIMLARILTPLGPMVAAATDKGLGLLEYADRRALQAQVQSLRKRQGGAVVPGRNAVLEQLENELADYFGGSLQEFAVPLLVEGTPFQVAVWEQLLAIPYGETRSYEQIARAIGRPKAFRAVGRANGDNRWTILAPCHRVVRSDGSLCGYGGGLWRKQWLLDHERGAR
ncbi:MAG TPA: methylated-DNA--[protein]-cysteine S-methyltransferase [Planctomycetota bacterium]